MSYSLMTISGEIQFPLNISSKMRISKSFDENSFYDELFRMSPYPLFVKIEELILTPRHSRKAEKHCNNPDSSSPPRPRNPFLLFRKNFSAKLKKEGKNLKNAEISKLAGQEWRNHQDVHWFFKILENLAEENHNRSYPNYKFSPKRSKKELKNKTNNKKPEIHKEEILETTSLNINDSANFNLQEINQISLVNDFPYDFSLYTDADPEMMNNFPCDFSLSTDTDSEMMNNLFSEVPGQNMNNSFCEVPNQNFDQGTLDIDFS
ncbi:10386_t:CDS:1, partial [Cetraspora pellucida]